MKKVKRFRSIMLLIFALILMSFSFGMNEVKAASWLWPVTNGKLGTIFSDTHTGIDINGVPAGTPVMAAASGTVTCVNNTQAGIGTCSICDMSGGGFHVEISHGNNIYSVYAHLSGTNTTIGSLVTQGQVIGYVGDTGNSYGAHLHFSISYATGGHLFWSDTLKNPLDYVSPNGTTAITLTNKEVTGITNTDAKISADLSPKSYVTTCGFYIGTSETSLVSKSEIVNTNVLSMWYTLTSDWQALSPGVKYYYKLFAIIGGVEYQSALSSFTTTGQASVSEVVNKPGKPMFSVTASFGGDIDFAWSAVANADNYDLRIFDYNSGAQKNTYWSIVGTSYTVTLPTGSYYATLCAVNMTTKAWTSSDHLNFDVDATKEYFITFNANGGNTSIPNITLKNAITYGTLPAPTFKGYSFIGWYTELNGGTMITSETSMPSKAKQTLYAHWTQLPSGLNNFGQVNEYKDGQFSDVSSGKWYSSNVAAAYSLGLMVGSSRTAFNLLGNVSIAEAITMASRLHCIFYSGSENFIQDGGVWYNIYVTYAANNGITTKIYDSYTRAATRAEFADLFANALPPEALAKINTVENNAIPDVSGSETYAQSVYLLYRAGIIVGSDNAGTFNAMSSINRAEAAAIVTRMADISMRQSVTLPKTQ